MRDLMHNVRRAIDSTLGSLAEAYVTEPKKFNLVTEMLSAKLKKSRQQDFEEHITSLNRISAELDGANLDDLNDKGSNFRSLKMDEVHNLNASFLKAMHFSNISDLNSKINMDTLAYMKISRDFGDFDRWQKDFIACALSSRSGFVITGYSLHLKRYHNFVIDGGDLNVPIGVLPVIVLDVSEGAYCRDYLADRKTYIHAMMKEFNWSVIEDRISKCEKIAKIGY
jgi:Fe-Mn family superoxide dismutase